MLLLIDNYDSFTYNLKDYFEQLGQSVLVKMNDELDSIDWNTLNIKAVVVSPGPNTPENAGQLMKYLPEICQKWPVLGICLGHQALGLIYGASLDLAIRPMHGKVSKIKHSGSGIFLGLNQNIDVCRYHSLVLKALENTDLIAHAISEDGENMGFHHKNLPISGIQFHPEAILTEGGLQMLQNWLNHIEKPAL